MVGNMVRVEMDACPKKLLCNVKHEAAFIQRICRLLFK